MGDSRTARLYVTFYRICTLLYISFLYNCVCQNLNALAPIRDIIKDAPWEVKKEVFIELGKEVIKAETKIQLEEIKQYYAAVLECLTAHKIIVTSEHKQGDNINFGWDNGGISFGFGGGKKVRITEERLVSNPNPGCLELLKTVQPPQRKQIN